MGVKHSTLLEGCKLSKNNPLYLADILSCLIRFISIFDLSHTYKGDGKVKYGDSVYVTSHNRSAAHHAGDNLAATKFYVYTVEVSDIHEDNYIAFK